MSSREPRSIVVELCQRLFASGWAPGTGGGASVRHEGRIYVAPSGRRKERPTIDDVYELDLDGNVVQTPEGAEVPFGSWAPLFMSAYRLRSAGAVIYSQSTHAVLAGLAFEREWQVTQVEAMKSLRSVGYHDVHAVPIVENVADPAALADAMADALLTHPASHALLIRRSGVYVWGRDGEEALTHAEVYTYLFELTLRMRQG
jgi:methylthioribulose-1-phosphate dehydratase